MTDDVRQQITDRYYKEYLKEAAQEPRMQAKINASPSNGLIAVACSTAAMVLTSSLFPVLAPVLVPVALAGLALSMVGGATITVRRIVGAEQAESRARKNINQDIDNGKLINRYKNDLIADQRQKLSNATQSLSALEQVSKLEDFQNVAARRAETLKESPVKPSAAPKINCLQ